jgi:hypothetical protein
MLSLYRALLCLYPAAFRSDYGDEMTSVFRDLDRETSARTGFQRAMLYIRELSGLLHGAVHEHSRTISAFSFLTPFSSQLPSRRFIMTSQFRFPKTTAVLMTIILAGVIMAIQKGTAIEASLPHTNPPITLIPPDHLGTFVPMILAMFLVVYAVAALGWIVLFCLRRTGVHRLSEMPAAPAPKS